MTSYPPEQQYPRVNNCDRHERPGHPYPWLPDGVRICDDEAAGGNYFLYRDRELIVHRDDYGRVLGELRRLGFLVGEDVDDGAPSPADEPLVLLRMISDSSRLDTVDLVRALQAAPPPSEGAEHRHGLRVWFNHVVSLQTHTTWGNGTRPEQHGALPPLPTGPDLPGAGVRVGMLDSGLRHQDWFGNRWTPVGGLSRSDVDERILGADPGNVPYYDAGHGTFGAGIILQHAPGAHLVVARMKDPTGCVSDWDLQGPLQTLISGPDPVHVLNLAFGGTTSNNLPMPGICSVLATALQQNPQLLVVASAGNQGSDVPVWPAAMDKVIGVGALNPAGVRWSMSNYGTWVDAWSRGQDLPSTFLWYPEPGGVVRRLWSRVTGPPPPFIGWARWSGTSFAAARVSGAVAAAFRPGRTPQQIVFDLVTSAPVRYGLGGVVDPVNHVLP
jgi:hypothetical protein